MPQTSATNKTASKALNPTSDNTIACIIAFLLRPSMQLSRHDDQQIGKPNYPLVCIIAGVRDNDRCIHAAFDCNFSIRSNEHEP